MTGLVSDYRRAANLIRLSAVLIPVEYLVDYLVFKKTTSLADLIFLGVMLGILFLIALFVSKEVKWVKWLFVILLALGMTLELLSAIADNGTAIKGTNLQLSIINHAFGFSEDLISLYAVYLLFVPNKNIEIDENDYIIDSENLLKFK